MELDPTLSLQRDPVKCFPSTLYNPHFSIIFLTSHLPGSLISTQHMLVLGGLTILCDRNHHLHFIDKETETHNSSNFPQIIQASKSQKQHQNSGLLSPRSTFATAKIQSCLVYQIHCFFTTGPLLFVILAISSYTV